MDVDRILDAAARLGASDEDRQLLRRCLSEGGGPAQLTSKETLRDVVDLLDDPRCSELQADGVPCGDPIGHCEGCRHAGRVLVDLIGQMRERAGG